MSVSTLYTSGDYLQKNPGWHVAASPWKAQAILKMMERNKLVPQTICDVGCGAGEILRLLQQKLDTSTALQGYDIAPQAIALAKERENERLHFTLANFQEEDTNTYDLILLIDVLQHFEDCCGFLRAIKPKSQYKILQLPLDVFVLSALCNQLVDYYHTAGHLHFFTKDSAIAILQKCGYEVLDVCYTLSPLDTDSWGSVKNNSRKLTRKLMRVSKRGLQRLPGSVLYPLNHDLAVRIFGGWRLLVLAK